MHEKDPEIGRIASRYPAAGGDLREPLDIVAFPVPEGVQRRAVRDALIARLAATGQLSALYCGFAPIEQNDLGEDASAFAEVRSDA